MPEPKLSSLHPGDSAIIRAISAEEGLHHRLLALGFRIGKEIHLIRRAWFSGPLQVRIGMTEVIMRRSDADKIRVSHQTTR
ncbi:MAG: FeoA family protein [Candidatus Methylumidiphilus sp.]